MYKNTFERLFFLASLLTITIFPYSYVNAAASDLDPTFAIGSGLGSQPLTLLRQPDGKLIVGGVFETVAGVRRKKIARLNTDGSLDTTFLNGVGVDGNGIVWTAAIQSNGKILIGGEFMSINGTPRTGLARLNSDGSLDQTFAPQISDRVLGITVQSNGQILIVGDFQSVNGSLNSRKLARLNSNGTLDTSFVNSLGNDVGNTILYLQQDGKLLVAGGSKRLTRLNTDGSQDSQFNIGGTGLDGAIFSIIVDASNNILVGGPINSYNGNPRSNLIRILPDGSLDQSFNPIIGGVPTSIGTHSNGQIVITGSSSVNGVSRSGMARLNFDGSIVTEFNPQFEFSGAVSKVIVLEDQKIVVGGQFTNISSIPRKHIALLNFDGSIDNNFARQRGPNNSVLSVLPLANGMSIVGGLFDSFDETPAGAIVRISNNGLLDTTFKTGTGFNGVVSRIGLQSDGKLIVGGAFTSFNGVNRNNIARLNQDGTLDLSFNTGAIIDGVLTDLEIQPDGRVVIVGLFNSISGVPGRHIARLNTNGTLDSSFNPGSGADFEIYDVALQPNGKILVGGNFDNFNGTPRSSIARLNSNGSLDNAFGGLTHFDSAILSLTIDPNGRVLVGGAFNTVNGQQRSHIARLTVNGTEDPTFVLKGGFSSDYVNKVVLQTDGKVIVGGRFLTLGSLHRANIGRLLNDGSVDLEFNVGGISGGVDDTEVIDIALQHDGKILFAGEFNALQGGILEARRLSRLMGSYVPSRDAPFDFDGDGKTDVGIYRTAVGEWWYRRSSDTVVAALQFGSPTDTVTPVDLSGDGKADPAFFRSSTGEWFILRSEDGSFYSFPFGTVGDVAVPADYDGDGVADAAVFRPSNNTWYILHSSDQGVSIIGFGTSGDRPINADFDGDGKADIGIFRPAVGEWWYMRSSDDQVAAFQFGNSTDKVVAADYTGDGKADPAFFRASSGEWFILRSEDASFYSFPFGNSTDVPTPGDYDGDGTTDAAVFRPSDGTWYIQGSTSGTQIIPFGSPGDSPLPNAFVR